MRPAPTQLPRLAPRPFIPLYGNVIQRWVLDQPDDDFLFLPTMGNMWDLGLGPVPITKLYDDTSFGFLVAGDMIPDASNPGPDTFYTGLFFDDPGSPNVSKPIGVDEGSVGLVGLPGQDITFWYGMTLTPRYKAGPHNVALRFGSFGHSGARILFAAKAWMIQIFEIAPPPDAVIGPGTIHG